MLAHMRFDSRRVGEEAQVAQLVDLVRADRDLPEVRDHPVDRGRAAAEERHARTRMGDLRGRSEDPRPFGVAGLRSEEHTSELQSRGHLVCRLLLEKKTKTDLK